MNESRFFVTDYAVQFDLKVVKSRNCGKLLWNKHIRRHI